MNPFRHVYRRGHIFWWRRVHRLFDGRTLDFRISLKTYERSQAVSRGAALTAASGGVLDMLNQRLAVPDAAATEEDLQTIAREAYGELLAELCAEQRATPGEAAFHSASNIAFADYYQRLANHGGHLSLLPEEEQRLALQGWDEQRIEDLRVIIKLREDKGYTRLKDDLIDAKLRALGQVHSFLREHAPGIPEIDFSKFMVPDIKDERNARAAYTLDQGLELFSLPPWTGCRSVDERLEPGDQIFHDSLFFVLLLVWYRPCIPSTLESPAAWLALNRSSAARTPRSLISRGGSANDFSGEVAREKPPVDV